MSLVVWPQSSPRLPGRSPDYKLILEDHYSRSYDICIPSHAFEPRHTHHNRVECAWMA